jgi:acetyl esterase/lipase
LHLNDPIVPLRMLQRLAASYMPLGYAGRFTRNPEVHPGLASDEVLARFPRTELVLGGLDPLLDDGIEFNSRLRRLGIPGEMLVYRALPHGFFTFSWLPPAAGAIESVFQFLTARFGLELSGDVV